MKFLKQLFSALTTLIQKHTYLSLGVGILFLVLIGIASFALIGQGGHKASPSVKTAQVKPVKDENPSTQVIATQAVAGEQTTSTAAKPTQPTPSVAKSLIVTPNNFTVKAGESLAVVMKASDGKAINYPGFSSNYNGKFIMNFAASPAKTVWSGPIMTFRDIAPGTYKLGVFAQDNKAAYYRGEITVTVVVPTMNIAVQPQGYEAGDDSVNYLIKINRLYGFDEPVTEVVAFSSSEPGLGCYYDIVDANTISLACGHDDPNEERPTSGTLSISIGTDSLERSSTVSYSLPPL